MFFFSRTCGYHAYRVCGPLRTGSVQHHVLFKVTPDATRRTKTAKCTKYQIFQLMLNGLKRCHALNAVQFGGDVSETHPDSVMNFHQISEICESNFYTPEVIGVPIGYVNRKNFNLAFQIPPGEECQRVVSLSGFPTNLGRPFQRLLVSCRRQITKLQNARHNVEHF